MEPLSSKLMDAPRTYKIEVLQVTDIAPYQESLNGFLKTLREAGIVQGENLVCGLHGWDYRFRTGDAKGLGLTFGLTYSGRRAGDTPINYTSLGVVGKTSFYLKPAYGTTASASYRWNDRYLFRLNVDNVFDDRDHIAVAGGRVSGTGITTAPGLNVKFSTTYEF